MTKFCTLFAMLFATLSAVGQYHTTFTESPYDLTANVKSGLNVWKAPPNTGLSGQATCQPGSGSMSFGGQKYYCVGTDNYPYSYDRRTHSWTKRTDLNATGMTALAVRNANAIYALFPSTNCPSPDKAIEFYNGSTWTLPGGAIKCLEQISVGADGFVAGIAGETGQNTLWYSQNNGASWTTYCCGWSYVHMWNQNEGCAIANTDGSVYTIGLNGTATKIGGSNFVGCVYGDRPFVLMAWDASGNVSMNDEQNGAWDVVLGLKASHIAGINKLMVVALDLNHHPYHWNIRAKSITGVTTGTWQGGCPSPGVPCHSTTQHRSTLKVWFSSGHGINGNLPASVQNVPWNAAMNNSFIDINPNCDPVFGPSTDIECNVESSGGEECMQSFTGLGTVPEPPSGPILSHDYQTAVSYFDRIGPQLDFIGPTGVQYWAGSEELNMQDSCLPGTFATCPGPDPHDIFELSTGMYGASNVEAGLNDAVTLANPYISEDWYEVVNGIPICDGLQITWGSYGNFDDPNFVPTCD